MSRYALKIEYDGTPFSGWQRQEDVPSVQAVIEAGLSKLEPAPVLIQGAGRTDAGVHAFAQVAHVDLARDWEPFRLREALNAQLRPHPIAITALARVDAAFHARFDAIGRRYLYRLLSRRAPAALDRGRVWHVRRALDMDAMRAGAAHLIGHHDFTTFRSVTCQAKSPIKTLDRLDIAQIGAEIHITVAARSFLHNQVRSFVGTLEKVGSGSWPPERVKTALEAKSRAACGPVAPPQGLYLSEVTYRQDPFTAQSSA